MWDWDRSSTDDPLGHFEVKVGEELFSKKVGGGGGDCGGGCGGVGVGGGCSSERSGGSMVIYEFLGTISKRVMCLTAMSVILNYLTETMRSV